MNSEEFFDVLAKIAGTNSRTEKEAILDGVIGDALALRVLRAAYDPLVTYGIKPKPPKTFGAEVFTIETEEFWNFLDDLKARRLTGHAARDAVDAWFKRLCSGSAHLLHRILTKDLRCGFTSGTINRVAPCTIPIFKVMLSEFFEPHRAKFPVAVEPKLDGYRAPCLINNGTARFFSRSGLVYPALDHLGPTVLRMVERAHAFAVENADRNNEMAAYLKLLGGDRPRIVLDGEALTGAFDKTSGDLRRLSEDATDVKLHLFDAVFYDAMADEGSKEWKFPLKWRRRFLQWIVSFAEAADPICVTPMELATSVEEIQAIYDRHRAAGLEGAMIKDLESPYQKRKGFHWMKLKPEETEDLPIKDAYEGEKGIEGMLGGFIVDRKGVDCRVGGGFTLKQRKEFWAQWLADPESLRQRLIEVEFHEVTKDGSLRHSRYKRFRDDKDEREVPYAA
jgi:DNA ligase 1